MICNSLKLRQIFYCNRPMWTKLTTRKQCLVKLWYRISRNSTQQLGEETRGGGTDRWAFV